MGVVRLRLLNPGEADELVASIVREILRWQRGRYCTVTPKEVCALLGRYTTVDLSVAKEGLEALLESKKPVLVLGYRWYCIARTRPGKGGWKYHLIREDALMEALASALRELLPDADRAVFVALDEIKEALYFDVDERVLDLVVDKVKVDGWTAARLASGVYCFARVR